MTFRTLSLASLIACVALFAPYSAQAEPSAAEISAAKQAFESALTAEAEQRWADAALKLREAVAAKDTPGLRFHLAHCETELGHLLEASLEYDRALELLRGGAKAPDVQKLLGPARAALLSRLPRLTLEIPADVHAPLIAIDEKRYPSSEVALGVPLNPGPHELQVQAAGRRAFERALSLKEGDRVVLPVALPLAAPPTELQPRTESPAQASASVASRPSELPSSSAKLYLMIGESVLTAAGLGVGIGYAVARGSASARVASAQADIEQGAPGDARACSTATPDPNVLGACSDLQAALDDHEQATTLSQIGFLTAGVGAVALLTTWLVYPSPSPRASAVSVRPLVGLGRLGVMGRF